MDSQIVLRQVAAAASDLVTLSNIAGCNLHKRTDRERASLGCGKLKGYPVISVAPFVIKHHWRRIKIANHNIDMSIVVQVAKRCSSGRSLLEQGWSGQRTGIAKSPVSHIHLEQFLLSIS